MARQFNIGLRNILLDGFISYTATTISFDSASKEIRDSGNALPRLNPGDKILVVGSSSNNGLRTLDVVTVNRSKFSVTESLIDESAGSDITIALLNSRSFRDLFRNGILEIYDGEQPTNPQTGESGYTRLLRFTNNKESFVPGQGTNGLNFEALTENGRLLKSSSENWQGEGETNGVAGWCRFYANHYPNGTDQNAIRFDGDVGIVGSGAMIELVSLTIQSGITTTLDTFEVDLGV